MLVTIVAVLSLLVVGSAIPGRRRALARAGLVWFAGLLPIVLSAWAISRLEGVTAGSYLALVPVIVTWCCILDARYGLSHRLARVGPRRDLASDDPAAG